ncbi:FecCD family ABC transporter permease [Kroppenstedtia eburnea]|uniref:FecCD family ABC transporter permease n=1 Tax=Kroppenstedtia eburnea TaxID=714067 RepID=UPI00363BBF3D
MKSRTWAFPALLSGFLLLFILMFFGAMVWGAADTTIRDVWLALTSSDTNQKMDILREIRFPREVAAIGVGAALAVSGAIMQGISRNPLADPGLLGLTAGANAALAIAMACFPGLDYFGIMIACFIGAGLASAVVFGLGSMQKGGASPSRLVLAGAAVSTFLIAVSEGVSLVFKISKDVSMWTAGGLIGTTWSQLLWVMPIIFIGILVAIYYSRQLTILSLDEEVAVGLGQKTQYIKGILFIATILLAGSSVSLAGNLVFVGLVVPHLVRALVGADYRLIIPSAAIVGATFMLLADTLGRTLQAPYETPVVAIIAMIGLPFFLVIVRKGGRAFS